jgi:hypothetical protein
VSASGEMLGLLEKVRETPDSPLSHGHVGRVASALRMVASALMAASCALLRSSGIRIGAGLCSLGLVRWRAPAGRTLPTGSTE